MLIRSYRVRGHLEARLDPLGLQIPRPHAELDARSYGFTDNDLDKPIFIDNVLGRESATLREIQTILRETYCGSIGVEFMHIQDPEQKSWIQRKVEGAPWRTAFDAKAKRTILAQLTEAEGFEAFCQKRYVTTKRFGLEGGEVTIPALHAIIETVASAGVSRDRHRHAASRPAEHAGQYREEAAHRGVLRVRRRELQAGRCAGVRRREVPPRHLDRHRDRRAQRAPVAAAQPVASGGGRSGGDRQGAGAPGPGGRHAAAVLGDGDPDARRRGVRRPGPGVRDAGDEPAHRLSHRRHGAPGGEQPDRLHHRPRARLFRPLLHRRGEVDPGADPARQRRRPRGGDLLRAYGRRVPHALRHRLRAGYRLLPPPRP